MSEPRLLRDVILDVSPQIPVLRDIVVSRLRMADAKMQEERSDKLRRNMDFLNSISIAKSQGHSEDVIRRGYSNPLKTNKEE